MGPSILGACKIIAPISCVIQRVLIPTLQSIIREPPPKTVLVVGPIFIFLIREVEAPLSPGELVDTFSER